MLCTDSLSSHDARNSSFLSSLFPRLRRCGLMEAQDGFYQQRSRLLLLSPSIREDMRCVAAYSIANRRTLSSGLAAAAAAGMPLSSTSRLNCHSCLRRDASRARRLLEHNWYTDSSRKGDEVCELSGSNRRNNRHLCDFILTIR